MITKKSSNHVFLLSILILLSCSSCSSDSEEEQISRLVGNYQLTELIANAPSTFNNGSNEPYNMVEELACYEAFLELKADSTVESSGRDILFSLENGSYVYRCSPEVMVEFLSWEDMENTVQIGRQNFQVIGNRLVLENDPNDPIVLYYRIVWTKE